MGGQGVFLLDLKTRKERRLYMGPQNSAYATFSPDGTQVAFGHGGGGWPAFVVPSAGGDAKPAGNAEGRIRGWTRDGRYLLVWRVATGATTIGVLDLTTGRPSETMCSGKDLGAPKLSPDNRWVAFQVDRRQRSQVFIAPFRGSEAVAESEWISIGPGVMPFWSPDSRTLYFARHEERAADASLVMRQPLDPASGRAAGAASEFYRFAAGLDIIVNTLAASRTHVYTLQSGGMSEIWMMDLPH
jgi:Tol biopolymer transport system component